MFIKVGLFSYTGIAVLQALGEKKLHIGATSDPTHQVRLNLLIDLFVFAKKVIIPLKILKIVRNSIWITD